MKQFAFIAEIASFVNRLKDGMMVGITAALLDTVSDMVEEAYDEEDEDEGALH